jgi:hypothetical protein
MDAKFFQSLTNRDLVGYFESESAAPLGCHGRTETLRMIRAEFARRGLSSQQIASLRGTRGTLVPGPHRGMNHGS